MPLGFCLALKKAPKWPLPEKKGNYCQQFFVIQDIYYRNVRDICSVSGDAMSMIGQRVHLAVSALGVLLYF
jgi:hypothetical protein